jgi:hypothetical protein
VRAVSIEALPNSRRRSMPTTTSQTPYERDGRTVVREEFVARHIGRHVVLTKCVVELEQAASPEGYPRLGSSSDPAVGL